MQLQRSHLKCISLHRISIFPLGSWTDIMRNADNQINIDFCLHESDDLDSSATLLWSGMGIYIIFELSDCSESNLTALL